MRQIGTFSQSSCSAQSFPFFPGVPGFALPWSLLQVRQILFMGVSQSPHSQRLGVIWGLSPVQKNMASTFLRIDAISMLVLGTLWKGQDGTQESGEEERDHLENGYLLMQKDTWKFVQCLVSPVLAKFCSFWGSKVSTCPRGYLTLLLPRPQPCVLVLQSEEQTGTPSVLSPVESIHGTSWSCRF